jgi:hypothetical protein
MKVRTLGAFVFAVLFAAVAHADNFVATSDSAAPFSSYNTYAWTAGTTSPDPLTERRIHAAVEAQFSGKVIRLAAPDETPDIYVATHVLTREQKDFDIKTYQPGTLVIDVYDAKTKKMVWRGVVTGTGSDKPSKNADKIEKALTDLFRRYPSSLN